MNLVITILSIVLSLLAGVAVFRKAVALQKRDSNLSKLILPPPNDSVSNFTATKIDSSLITRWAKECGYIESPNSPQGLRYFSNSNLFAQPLVVVLKIDDSDVTMYAYVIMSGNQVSVANNPMNKINLRMKKALRDTKKLQGILTS